MNRWSSSSIILPRHLLFKREIKNTCNPEYDKLMSMVAFSVISDSQKLSVSPSVASSIGCAVSAKRDTVLRSPSKFFRHLAGSATFIFGWVGGQRQLLATYATGSTPVKASIASLKRKIIQAKTYKLVMIDNIHIVKL